MPHMGLESHLLCYRIPGTTEPGSSHIKIFPLPLLRCSLNIFISCYNNNQLFEHFIVVTDFKAYLLPLPM